MATTTTPYLTFLVAQMNGNAVDFDTNTLKMALVTSSYTPNFDTDDFFNDASTYELASGNGYTTGGVTLSGASITGDTANDRAEADYTDPSWTFTATKSFRYAILYKSTGDNSTSQMIACIDFGTTRNESSAFAITIPADGLIQFRASPQTV